MACHLGPKWQSDAGVTSRTLRGFAASKEFDGDCFGKVVTPGKQCLR